MARRYDARGGEWGLVSLPVFKTGEPGDPRLAGSIPVRLRLYVRRTAWPDANLTRRRLRRLSAASHSRPPPLLLTWRNARAKGTV
jgi:hypothetical protein